METFLQRLERGRDIERAVFGWLRTRHPTVSFYEWPFEETHGPQISVPPRMMGEGIASLPLPDGAIIRHGELEFVEVKSKRSFSWGWEKDWQVGLELDALASYHKIDTQVAPVWIFFLVQEDVPSLKDRARTGCPAVCPRGLFGITVSEIEARRQDAHTNHGIIYLNRKWMHFLAPYEDIQKHIPAEADDSTYRQGRYDF